MVDFLLRGDFSFGFDMGLGAGGCAQIVLKVARLLAEIVPDAGDFSLRPAAEKLGKPGRTATHFGQVLGVHREHGAHRRGVCARELPTS